MPRETESKRVRYPYHQYPFILPPHQCAPELLNGETLHLFKGSPGHSELQVTCEVICKWKQKIAEKLAENAAKNTLGPPPNTREGKKNIQITVKGTC